MKKQENKVDFDLSVLKLEELIKVYDDVDNFSDGGSDADVGTCDSEA